MGRGVGEGEVRGGGWERWGGTGLGLLRVFIKACRGGNEAKRVKGGNTERIAP